MTDISEDSIKEKFVEVYLLLDEMADGGMPFTTYPNILTDMISSSSAFKDLVDIMIPLPAALSGSFGEKLGNPSGHKSSLPVSTASLMPWRTVGINYANNEIYFDIIEEIDCIIERTGRVISCDLYGSVDVNCRLSGTPDLSLSFLNSRSLDNISFHSCVRFRQWDNSKIVSFIPPDGKFKLMEFTVSGGTQGIDIPIYITPSFTWSQAGGRVNITLGAKGSVSVPIEDICIRIPFSKHVSSTNLTTTWGHVSYDEITKVLTWKIIKLPRDKISTLSGSVTLLQGANVAECRPIIDVNWKVTQYSASGLKVDSLSVQSVSYKPFKGVRSITQAGKFEVRT
eukprot:TRINITY_DN12502_c0_g2_i1.p1 TRINITY_DN12502_c0_g2~~TRINITY_DN12502_c0_g2_i1.p1  ORF type:complete len:373 (+),score=36.41 TRINITY_DN12502_c0_g2_i1:102-1121(+)